MNMNTMNNLNNTMNNMNRCIGTQSKMIYGCHQNYRMLDAQSQVANPVHQAQNPHQLPTQQITKINTKSDQQQPNKEASDNQQNLSFSQDQQPPTQPQTQPTNTHLSPFGKGKGLKSEYNFFTFLNLNYLFITILIIFFIIIFIIIFIIFFNHHFNHHFNHPFNHPFYNCSFI